MDEHVEVEALFAGQFFLQIAVILLFCRLVGVNDASLRTSTNP